MAESNWCIQKGNVKIYGVLNTHAKRKNTRAILYVHGLTGGAYDFAATIMAQTMPKKCYDVIRVYLYHWNKDARQLIDTTIAIHGQDITTVVQHFKKKYKKIFATGHSYGAPSLMHSKTNLLDGMALWDGTTVPAQLIKASDAAKDYLTIKYGRIMKWGGKSIMGNDMIEHSRSLDAKAMQKLTAKCKVPTLVVEAADGFWINQPDKYIDWLTCEKKRVVIKNTVHCFYEEGTTAPLLRATKAWFDRY
jgi:hypothetical protein